jgi:hypothetical protein
MFHLKTAKKKNSKMAPPSLTIKTLLIVLILSLSLGFVASQHNPLGTDLLQSSGMNEASSCDDHFYTVHIFSKDPLVVYIESFITKNEIKHILNQT